MVMMALCVSLISFQHLIFGHQEGTSLGIDGIVIDKPEGSQPILVVFIFALTYCLIMALLVMV